MSTQQEVVTLMMTPALLISGSTMMVNVTSTRYGRVIDKLRGLARSLRKHRHVTHRDDDARTGMLRAQVDVLKQRAQFLRRAMSRQILAQSLFIASSVALAIDYVLPAVTLYVPFACMLVGMICLWLSTHLLSADTRLSFSAVARDLDSTIASSSAASEAR